MSNIGSRSSHLNGIEDIVFQLAETGWVFKRPSYTRDNKAYLCRGIPPLGERHLRFAFVGADENKFYVIVIGDKWNTVGTTTEKKEEVAIDTLYTYLEKGRLGHTEELPTEVNDLLAAIAEEDA
jgi:hypothetical protein